MKPLAPSRWLSLPIWVASKTLVSCCGGDHAVEAATEPTKGAGFTLMRFTGTFREGGLTMFYEWVSAGAIFGIEAFFAIFTFLLFCAAVLGMVALVGNVIRAGSGDKDDLDRH